MSSLAGFQQQARQLQASVGDVILMLEQHEAQVRRKAARVIPGATLAVRVDLELEPLRSRVTTLVLNLATTRLSLEENFGIDATLYDEDFTRTAQEMLKDICCRVSIEEGRIWQTQVRLEEYIGTRVGYDWIIRG